jgi:hypothetical protein
MEDGMRKQVCPNRGVHPMMPEWTPYPYWQPSENACRGNKNWKALTFKEDLLYWTRRLPGSTRQENDDSKDVQGGENMNDNSLCMRVKTLGSLCDMVTIVWGEMSANVSVGRTSDGLPELYAVLNIKWKVKLNRWLAVWTLHNAGFMPICT